MDHGKPKNYAISDKTNIEGYICINTKRNPLLQAGRKGLIRTSRINNTILGEACRVSSQGPNINGSWEIMAYSMNARIQ